MITQKGKGYAPAEASSDKYHGVGKFDVVSGKIKKSIQNAPSYTNIFAESLIKEATYDDKIVGKGNLESFTLYPLSTSLVKGTFTTNTSSDESKSVKISGVTKYDLLITSIDVPFDYYPNEEQTRKFIQ